MRRRYPAFCRAVAQTGDTAARIYHLARAAEEQGHHSRALLISGIARFLTGVEIHPRAVIGDRLSITHGYGTVIGPAVIGDDFRVLHGVTIGLARADGPEVYPTIGNRVSVYAGAVIIGDVTIGDDAVVAANAVVLHDVPAGAVVGGVPARVLKP